MSYGTLRHQVPMADTPFAGRPLWVIQATPDVTMRLKRIFPRIESYLGLRT